MAKLQFKEHLSELGLLIFSANEIDFDNFPQVGQQLVELLSARVIEKQQDADMHTWLIDFDEQRFFLKAEHYSQTVWFEALQVDQSEEELQFIARIMRRYAC